MMQQFLFLPFSKELAQQYSHDICSALDQIPLVDLHTLEDLLMKQKGDRILHNKWEHSYILLNDDEFVGIIIGYERSAEGNEQYPYNSIYLSDLAVAEKYQKMGIGKFLVTEWLRKNTEIGLLTLEGKLRFSVQTNSAEFNKHVQRLYESFGFKKIAEKHYDNRVDFVYLLEVERNKEVF